MIEVHHRCMGDTLGSVDWVVSILVFCHFYRCRNRRLSFRYSPSIFNLISAYRPACALWIMFLSALKTASPVIGEQPGSLSVVTLAGMPIGIGTPSIVIAFSVGLAS